MKNTKVIIKSLTQYQYTEPYDNEKCGALIKNLYAAIARHADSFGDLNFSVIKHDHRKAIIMVHYEFVSDYIKFKEYFYRYYADKFNWREKWHAK